MKFLNKLLMILFVVKKNNVYVCGHVLKVLSSQRMNA